MVFVVHFGVEEFPMGNPAKEVNLTWASIFLQKWQRV
jgi:hypothetical protein